MDILSKILDRLVKNYRSVRKGFPDLTVWNPVKKEVVYSNKTVYSSKLSVQLLMIAGLPLQSSQVKSVVCHCSLIPTFQLPRVWILF